MEFLSKLKGLVIQDDTVQAAPVTAPVQQVASTPMQAVAFDSNIASVLDVVSLEQTIDGNIQAAPEFAPFLKFQETATSLEVALKDEATRFASAAAVTKIDKATLIAAVDSHKQVLVNEAANFEAQFVSNSAAAIQSTQLAAESVAQEITELTAKLGELSGKKIELEKSAVDQTGVLAKAKIDFATVTANLEKRYGTIAGKLQQYVGA